MSPDTQRDHVTKKGVVYRVPGADAVIIQGDVEFRAADAGVLAMDIYYPSDSNSAARMPAVVVVAGYPDEGFQRILGCKFKEMESSISWGRLLAASGIVAITYTNSEPAVDLRALLEHLRQNAASLRIDQNRIGVWANSGNVPLALSVLMHDTRRYLKCAVLCYGYTLTGPPVSPTQPSCSGLPIRAQGNHSRIFRRICRCSL